ncbi:MAG: SMP-30/gluconolactonase/LRE family protein [bacterium]|nr:SMP-30/gluconolactonase/LRE family protein [bacterium]
MNLENILPVQNQAGETPIWVPQENAVYWVNICGPAQVLRLDIQSGQKTIWDLDIPVTSLARRQKGGWILPAHTGLYFWDQQENKTSFIVDPEANNPDVRFNDCAVDRSGRLLIGTLNEQDFTKPHGSLYRLDADLSIHKIDDGYATTNGIGFSLDGRTLYVAESFAHRIIAHDYDPDTGTVSNRRVFAQVPEEYGFPDGLIVDADGYIWNGHWAGGLILRYTPNGEVDRRINMTVPNIISMCFAGQDMQDMYVTTAWHAMSDDERAAYPQSGDLFRIRTDVCGLTEPMQL